MFSQVRQHSCVQSPVTPPPPFPPRNLCFERDGVNHHHLTNQQQHWSPPPPHPSVVHPFLCLPHTPLMLLIYVHLYSMYITDRLHPTVDRESGVAGASSLRIEPIMTLQGHALCTAVEGCWASVQCQVFASTVHCRETKTRAAKGSTLLRRRFTLPIYSL